ncbi:replicative DNA helicase [Xanthomonas sp. PPL568]|uniref:replicative DNA helicase n=1 Tax=Xanthomonas indica TaxID=2912242 RepID=UPI001F57A5CB|nr:replicative DNA helicase [Xanthomonas indica]MCI2243812.1 replicative DNA helicase [Xanthomonas indica]
MNAHDELDRMEQLYGGPRQQPEHHHAIRVPPHSVDAEQAVLGGLMLRGSAWDQVGDLLTEQDFYRRDHQAIFRAVRELAKTNRPFDTVTLGDWFQDQGTLELVGDGAYLVELSTTVPSTANIRAYAEIVADKARLRRIIEVGTEFVDSAFASAGRSSLELIGEAQTRMGALLDNQPCDLEPVAPVMQRVFDRLGERSRGEGDAQGLSTSIDQLDALIGGLKPGGLYVLAARPKMGKTTLAQNIAEHVALVRGVPVAVFSFEMQPEELGDRMLASVGNIDGGRIRSGELDDVDWTNVTAAMKRLRAAEIYVSKPRNARVEHVVAQVRRQHARKPLGLVVIDYLQLMQISGDNRAQGFGDITRALKMMAGELGIPVLLLSQLNRKLEDRPDKRPQPADLRDSGSIEQDADAVIFIYRDEVYHRESRWKGTAELIVALQRNGPAGEVRALYMPERFKFQNLPEYWQPAPIESDDRPAPKPRGFRKVTAAAARQDGDA